MDARHVVVLLLMLATGFVLLCGIVLMMVGGDLNRKYGNKMMVARVSLQAVTILLIGALFLFGKS